MIEPLRLPFAIAAMVSLVLAGSVKAQDASAWSADTQSSVRLLAGSNNTSAAGPWRAGVEIKLQPGWKTYWRYPGDSGIPPDFNFAGSENVADVQVLWPAPHRFTDETGHSIGYKGAVIFPLRVMLRDASRPATLRMQLHYAVCERLCMPAQAKSSLRLEANPSAHDAALAAAEARVPVITPAGAGGLSVNTVRRTAGSGKPNVYVEVTAPAGSKPELFAEGPSADWALPIPMPVPGAPPGKAHFHFELDGLPPAADPNAKDVALKLTLVAGDSAIETVVRLD